MVTCFAWNSFLKDQQLKMGQNDNLTRTSPENSWFVSILDQLQLTTFFLLTHIFFICGQFFYFFFNVVFYKGNDISFLNLTFAFVQISLKINDISNFYLDFFFTSETFFCCGFVVFRAATRALPLHVLFSLFAASLPLSKNRQQALFSTNFF